MAGIFLLCDGKSNSISVLTWRDVFLVDTGSACSVLQGHAVYKRHTDVHHFEWSQWAPGKKTFFSVPLYSLCTRLHRPNGTKEPPTVKHGCAHGDNAVMSTAPLVRTPRQTAGFGVGAGDGILVSHTSP